MAESWTDANQRFLMDALAEVRVALQRHGSDALAAPPHSSIDDVRVTSPLDEGAATALADAPPALELLSRRFGLSPFERRVLLMCAGVELDASFASLCASAQGNPARAYPTFSLALAALAEPHWSALAPSAPLRRWRLIEIASQPGTPMTVAPLRIDERVLHYLTGVQHLDERLVGLVEPVEADELVPSHQAIARQIAAAWDHAGARLAVIEVFGGDEAARWAIARAGCAEVGLALWAIAAHQVPAAAGELEAFVRLWEREAALTASALVVEAEGVDRADARAVAPVVQLLQRINSPVLVSTRDRWRPLRREVQTLTVDKPTRDEQRRVWRSALGEATAGINGHLEALVSQFDFSAPVIRAAARTALATQAEGAALGRALWDAGRAQARPRLEDLAERIVPRATWDDLVLGEAETSVLREIAAHVAHRTTVYETWGLAAKSTRGLGISALFAGASGTGKTLAAEVLAQSLRLDLYRIDLSGVVSKYIGETEKNLRRVFDAAEEGGAILFFDEADALFGKRSEVKDSHDRYANVEINYLLQRMESYRGLAVLATNMKGALDPAFLRRIRFVVNFPFPDVTQRAELWRRMFPAPTPTEGLDVTALARLNIAGGNIRNIALNAAFLAAEAAEPVRMPHILRAVRSEYAKLERPLTDAETRDLVR
jgi:ATPase family protein associated with various cellular activities (AAA)/winged helix domain-containing protein